MYSSSILNNGNHHNNYNTSISEQLVYLLATISRAPRLTRNSLMPRLSGVIERSFGLYGSSRHARQGQHHLDCSLVSLSGIAQALTNLCWPRCSGRFQMYMPLLPKFKKIRPRIWNKCLGYPDNNATKNLFPNSLDSDWW